jgi:glycerophosphoryl diester phosphodiesterase
MRHPYFDLPIPIVIGHRGAAGAAPENTLESFRRGVADGAAIVETDLHATRDGVLVLLHDDDVARTTDGAGLVSTLTLAELKRLDAGHRFAADGSFPWRGKGARIPTLEEAFAALPGVRFNIEIKEAAPGVVERTLETVARAGRAGLTLLAAEKDAIMASIREAVARTGTNVAIGACVGEVLRCVRAALDGAAAPEGVMALQIPADFGGRPVVTPELMMFAHANEIQVHVWTINDPAQMHALLDLGVDGIISDHPARMRDVVMERTSG